MTTCHRAEQRHFDIDLKSLNLKCFEVKILNKKCFLFELNHSVNKFDCKLFIKVKWQIKLLCTIIFFFWLASLLKSQLFLWFNFYSSLLDLLLLIEKEC